jgi:hypothetical protein
LQTDLGHQLVYLCNILVFSCEQFVHNFLSYLSSWEGRNGVHHERGKRSIHVPHHVLPPFQNKSYIWT